MQDHGKHGIVPYKPLITFANKQITEDNWADVLSDLGSQPVPEGMPEKQTRKWMNDTYSRLGWMTPQTLDGKPVDGSRLQKVQGELRRDLARITNPTDDIEAAAEDFDVWRKVADKVFDESRQQGLPLDESLKKANSLPKPPGEKNLQWLIDKYQRLTRIGEPRQTTYADGQTPIELQRVGEIRIPMTLFSVRSRAVNGDWRVLITDRVYFVPTINDLRTWVYFRLAKLWEDGLLPQLERCQRCKKFFLAKTQRKTGTAYCSQACAQGKNAAARTKATRARRRAWGYARKDLEQAMVRLRTLPHSTGKTAIAREESTLHKAEDRFQKAYPREQGPGYEEGKAFLGQARKLIKKLQKKD